MLGRSVTGCQRSGSIKFEGDQSGDQVRSQFDYS
jgi:hypothetical protein